jgi:hypothetical protein
MVLHCGFVEGLGAGVVVKLIRTFLGIFRHSVMCGRLLAITFSVQEYVSGSSRIYFLGRIKTNFCQVRVWYR